MPSATLERVSEAAINTPSLTTPQHSLIEVPLYLPKSVALDRLGSYLKRNDTGHQTSLFDQVEPFYPDHYRLNPKPVNPETAELAAYFQLNPEALRSYELIKADQPVAEVDFVRDPFRIAVMQKHRLQFSSILPEARVEQKADDLLHGWWTNRPLRQGLVPTEVMQIKNFSIQPERIFVHHLQAALIQG